MDGRHDCQHGIECQRVPPADVLTQPPRLPAAPSNQPHLRSGSPEQCVQGVRVGALRDGSSCSPEGRGIARPYQRMIPDRVRLAAVSLICPSTRRLKVSACDDERITAVVEVGAQLVSARSNQVVASRALYSPNDSASVLSLSCFLMRSQVKDAMG